jgi:Cdc6-like AAA superfamily ATPase
MEELFAQASVEEQERRSGSLPKFRATAADQVDRARQDRLVALRMGLRNAFTPSQPIADRRMFAGREDVLNTIISAIEDQRLHVVIYGERGIGKTSLLHTLSAAARDAKYIVVYGSCGAASTFEETFRGAATEIPLLFHTAYGPTTEEAEAGATVADLLPDKFTPRQFADVCSKLTGTRALIVLDEFDRAEAMDFRRDLAETIKFLSDRSVRVQLVIAGVAGDLADLMEHIPSIRRNVLAVRVPRMTDEEVQQLVKLGEKASGLTFAPEARDALVTLCRGWPYVASLLCHHAGLQALDAGRTVIIPDDVYEAVNASATDLSSRLPKRIKAQIERLLADGASRTLTVLAGAALTAGGDFDAADIEALATSTAEAADVKRVAERLATERVLVEQRDDAYGRRYGFVEDSLAPYLWFIGAQQHRKAPNKPQRASAG